MKYVKKFTGFLVAWILFWIGDLAGRISLRVHIAAIWQIYQVSMKWSSDVQDWAGNETPWKNV